MTEEYLKQTLSIPELAKVLGISRGLAYDLAKKNELPIPVLRLGPKRMVVSRKCLADLLSSGLQNNDDE